MGWSATKTWNVGDLLTAADMNTYVRDQFDASNSEGTLKFFIQTATAVETVINGGWLECNGALVSRTTYADLFTLFAGLRSIPTGSTTLNGDINAAQTTLTLTAWVTSWPISGNFLIACGSETMMVTAGHVTTSLTMVRAVEGTAAAAHLSGVAVTRGSELPFGNGHGGPSSGDGATNFTVPDLRGRMVVAAADGTGHSDVQTVGGCDGSTLAVRRPKHYHTTHVNKTAGTGVSGAAGGVGGDSAGDWSSSIYPNGPEDAPAYLVTGVWGVKT